MSISGTFRQHIWRRFEKWDFPTLFVPTVLIVHCRYPWRGKVSTSSPLWLRSYQSSSASYELHTQLPSVILFTLQWLWCFYTCPFSWPCSYSNVGKSATPQTTLVTVQRFTGISSPISGYWDVYNTKAKCLPEPPTLIASVVYTLFFDIVVYVLPMPILWKVQIPLRQKAALIGVFALGSL